MPNAIGAESPHIAEQASRAQLLLQMGYLQLYGDALDQSKLADVAILESAFDHDLVADPTPGNRLRAHSAYLIKDGVLTLRPNEPYVQDASYNPDAAGKKRYFQPITKAVLESDTLKELVRFYIELCRAAMPELFVGLVELGLHLIRYRPYGEDGLSFSSPLVPHKDQEQFVAVVLAGRSGNLGGGENLILSDDYRFTRRLELQEQFESLVLTKKHKHSVQPMHSLNDRPAYRDVVLVTFKAVTEQ